MVHPVDVRDIRVKRHGRIMRFAISAEGKRWPRAVAIGKELIGNAGTSQLCVAVKALADQYGGALGMAGVCPASQGSESIEQRVRCRVSSVEDVVEDGDSELWMSVFRPLHSAEAALYGETIGYCYHDSPDTHGSSQRSQLPISRTADRKTNVTEMPPSSSR